MDEEKIVRLLKWLVVKMLDIEHQLQSLDVKVTPSKYLKLIESKPDISDIIENIKELEELKERSNNG